MASWRTLVQGSVGQESARGWELLVLEGVHEGVGHGCRSGEATYAATARFKSRGSVICHWRFCSPVCSHSKQHVRRVSKVAWRYFQSHASQAGPCPSIPPYRRAEPHLERVLESCPGCVFVHLAKHQTDVRLTTWTVTWMISSARQLPHHG